MGALIGLFLAGFGLMLIARSLDPEQMERVEVTINGVEAETVAEKAAGTRLLAYLMLGMSLIPFTMAAFIFKSEAGKDVSVPLAALLLLLGSAFGGVAVWSAGLALSPDRLARAVIEEDGRPVTDPSKKAALARTFSVLFGLASAFLLGLVARAAVAALRKKPPGPGSPVLVWGTTALYLLLMVCPFAWPIHVVAYGFLCALGAALLAPFLKAARRLTSSS